MIHVNSILHIVKIQQMSATIINIKLLIYYIFIKFNRKKLADIFKTSFQAHYC